MAYQKQVWVNDQTGLSAENINRIEEALALVSEKADNTGTNCENNTTAIKNLTVSLNQANKTIEKHEIRIKNNEEICKRLEDEASDNFDHVDVNGNTLTFWANGEVVERVDFVVADSDGVIAFPGKDGREVQLRRNEVAIQWKYSDEVQWKTLVMLDEIKGDTGKMPKITIGTITTVEPGEGAYVENIGTEEDVILNFRIPKGEKGEKGDDCKGNDGNPHTQYVLNRGNRIDGVNTTGKAVKLFDIDFKDNLLYTKEIIFNVQNITNDFNKYIGAKVMVAVHSTDTINERDGYFVILEGNHKIFNNIRVVTDPNTSLTSVYYISDENIMDISKGMTFTIEYNNADESSMINKTELIYPESYNWIESGSITGTQIKGINTFKPDLTPKHGSTDPITAGIIPEFLGQVYVVIGKGAYMATGFTSATWKRITMD